MSQRCHHRICLHRPCAAARNNQVRLLVSDRWVRSASKLALEGVNEKLLQKCTEAERLENKETLESDAADLAMASVQSHRAEVGAEGVAVVASGTGI